MKYLITGGCGFLGSNLASEVLRLGDQLYIFDNLSRFGSTNNLKWLRSLGNLNFIHGDIRNYSDVLDSINKIKPDIVFHLAGQVAMTTSISNPRKDFEINTIGTINLLESIRISSPDTLIIYSSTNKVYGDLENINYDEHPTRYSAADFPNGFNEELSLDFRSPYGCSKGSADQYVLDYSRNFSLKTIVLRHSSIFGNRQFSTFDQGWVGWFIEQALNQKSNSSLSPFTICGNGKQVRDILFASDLISCYFSAIKSSYKASGHVFNIGGGFENSLSLIELFNFLEERLSINLNYTKIAWRSNDQKVFIADISKANRLLDWSPAVSKFKGIEMMIDWLASNRKIKRN